MYLVNVHLLPSDTGIYRYLREKYEAREPIGPLKSELLGSVGPEAFQVCRPRRQRESWAILAILLRDLPVSSEAAGLSILPIPVLPSLYACSSRPKGI